MLNFAFWVWNTLLNKQAQVIGNINAQKIDAESRKKEILGNIAFEDFAIEVIEIREESEGVNYSDSLENARIDDALDNWLLGLLGSKAYSNFVEIADASLNASLAKVVWALDVEYYDSSE